jgi:hypothetical protein
LDLAVDARRGEGNFACLNSPLLSWILAGASAFLPTHLGEIAGIARDLKDARNFLRPAKNSVLAGGGADGDLPTYVGAVPPEGVEQWDWQKTWDTRLAKSANATKTGKD